MSEDQLSALLAKLKEDEGLREKLKGATDVDTAVAIAREAGFNLRQADLIRYQARKSLELGDDELEQVAGGDGWLSITCPTYGGECKKTDQCYVFSCNF